jgi:hypothetical protein
MAGEPQDQPKSADGIDGLIWAVDPSERRDRR